MTSTSTLSKPARGSSRRSPQAPKRKAAQPTVIESPRTSPAIKRNQRNGTAVSGPAGRGRVVSNTAKHGVSTLELTRCLYDQPMMWDLVDELQVKLTGAPRKLPEVMYLAGIGYQYIYGSFRNMQAELDEQIIWNEQIDIVAEMQATYRPDWAPLNVDALKAKAPLTAQNIHDARRLWAGPAMARLEENFERNAADIAKAVGYGDPQGRGSLNAPVRERFITTDGKVTTPIGSPYRRLLPNEEDAKNGVTAKTHVYSKAEDKIVNAAHMPVEGVHLYNTGKGPAVGFKTISTALRNDLTNSTVVLTMRQQQTHSEANEACGAILDVHRRLGNGLLGAAMDAAMTGVHIARLASEGGMVGVSPIKAKSVADGRKEKSTKVLDLEHDHPAGGKCCHTYVSYAGGLAEAVTDDQGKIALHRFPAGHIERRSNKGGGFRMYVGWRLTCSVGLPEGAPPVLLKEQRFNVTETPDASGFNVAENLRLVAPGTERYEGIYGWRQEEEARNNHRDEAKHNRQARSHTARRSFENEIGAAIVRNGLAARLHRERTPLAAAA